MRRFTWPTRIVASIHHELWPSLSHLKFWSFDLLSRILTRCLLRRSLSTTNGRIKGNWSTRAQLELRTHYILPSTPSNRHNGRPTAPMATQYLTYRWTISRNVNHVPWTVSRYLIRIIQCYEWRAEMFYSKRNITNDERKACPIYYSLRRQCCLSMEWCCWMKVSVVMNIVGGCGECSLEAFLTKDGAFVTTISSLFSIWRVVLLALLSRDSPAVEGGNIFYLPQLPLRSTEIEWWRSRVSCPRDKRTGGDKGFLRQGKARRPVEATWKENMIHVTTEPGVRGVSIDVEVFFFCKGCGVTVRWSSIKTGVASIHINFC